MVFLIPKVVSENEKRVINLQVRINKLEKDKLDKVCNTLNLTYTEFFSISLDNLSNYIQNGVKSQNNEFNKND